MNPSYNASTMRIALFSDLHRECSTIDIQSYVKDADVVVLAGDIDEGLKGVEWAKTIPKPVIYVPGNHEYDYGNIQELNTAYAQDHGNVHVLQNKQCIIGNVRFLGCTLWTDFEYHGFLAVAQAMEACEQGMPEYKVTRYDDHRVTPKDILGIHRDSRGWLNAMLNTPFDGDTVVVTHHAPHPKSILPRYYHEWITAAFASNCEELMHRPFLWMHGHTHEPVDYWVGDTRVVSHPRGYFNRKDQVPAQWGKPMLVDSNVEIPERQRKHHVAGVITRHQQKPLIYKSQ